ncbi:hypothetical protein Tco_0393077 [Tanacetum coccineum]
MFNRVNITLELSSPPLYDDVDDGPLTPAKNVKKISISNASLILEDFNPPLYELPFHKEVPGIARIVKTRARGFALRSLDLHILSFILEIQYPNLID